MTPANPSVIGRSVPRVDGRQKVAGLTRFAGDVQLPGMLHARLVLAPHPHARITRIATDQARAVPGVIGVFTGRDLPVSKPDPGNRNRSPLAIDEVLFNGHPVVAIVAESEAVAEDAAALVEVDYEELPAVVDALAAMRPGAPRVRPKGGGADDAELAMHGAEQGGKEADDQPSPNVASAIRFARGDVDAALRASDVVIERTYRTAIGQD